jgi:type III pantothenate kinase
MNRPLIAVDIGNTSIKLGVFKHPQDDIEPSLYQDISEENLGALEDVLPAEPCDWFIASVNRDRESVLRNWCEDHRSEDSYRVFNHLDYPNKIDVLFPDKVGADRLVAAAAATKLKPPENHAIVVDSGTAITVDSIAADGTFRGGAILPGWHLASRALRDGTDQLPASFVHSDQPPPEAIGRCTESAIQAGVYWGSVGAVNLLIEKMLAENQDSQTEIFVTGGDAKRVAAHLTFPMNQQDHLVLRGLVICSSAK